MHFSETVVPEIFLQVKKKISKLLETARCLSFTTDIWTSSNNHGFISLTVHWISEDFSTNNFLLSMSHFPGSHTTQAIGDKISSLLADWEIPKANVHLIVR